MATSTVPAVKARLMTLFQAALTADGGMGDVALEWGPPVKQAQEQVMLLDADTEQEPASLGNLDRDEKYTLDVWTTKVASARESQQTVTERAYAIVAVLENKLREDPGLGAPAIAALVVAQPTGASLREGTDGQQRFAEVHMPVSVHARL